MNLNSKDGLVQRLSRGQEARDQFVSSQLDKFIAFQIRALRDREGMNQTVLAEKLGSTQNSISRFESPNKGRPTITTLKKIAAVFDVGLEVRFVSFGKLVKYVSGTPYVETGMSTDSYYVPSFDNDPDIVSQSATAEVNTAEDGGYWHTMIALFTATIHSGRTQQPEDNPDDKNNKKKPPQSAMGNSAMFGRQQEGAA